MDTRQTELDELRLELERAQGHIEELRTQLEVHSLEPTQLREVVLNLEQQLIERDEELEKHRGVIREAEAWRQEMESLSRETEEELRRGIAEVRAELELIRSTRLWRAGERYRALKERLRRVLRASP